MDNQTLLEVLKSKGLKITPQRLAVYQAVYELGNHPTAEQVIDYIKVKHPGVSIGTVYKILDLLAEHQLISKVKTDRDIMRYDAILQKHHHLYCCESDRIEDYSDTELDLIIQEYFKRKKIKNFEIQDIKLQISGKFL